MAKLGSSFDGVIFADWRVEGDKLVRTMRQPSEDAILSFNDEIRKNPDALKRLEWGRWVASIPENIYWLLVKKYPELQSLDAKERTAAWLRIINSPEYERLRLQDRNLARG